MSIIRGALADASFDRVYISDQQFRVRKSLNPTRPWSQVIIYFKLGLLPSRGGLILKFGTYTFGGLNF
jgi:hypothetical protein